MKKIILIGEIENYEKPTGPGNVVKNLILELEKNNYSYDFINSYSNSKKTKVKLIFNLLKIVFMKNQIINVHTFGYSVPLFIYYISKINNKNKYFLTLHGIYSIEQTIEFGEKINKKILKKEKKLIKKFPNIICVSKFLKIQIKKKYKREKNVDVVYNAIDMSYLKKQPKKLKSDEIRIIAAGGISNRKSVLELADLVIYLNKNENKKIKVDIYGSICNEKLYELYKEKVSNIHNINYCGSIKFSDLMNEYYESHFLIALTKFDTFNLTVLESMSQFTPAIVSNKAGVAELIQDFNNGFVIDISRDYYNEIKKIIDITDTEEYQKIRKEACKTAKQFDTENMFSEYIKVFEKEKLSK